MDQEKERGALVIEATMALTIFMFTIFTILYIANICFIQAKMSTSLNTAAKEVSQYSYLYFKLGVNKAEQAVHEEAQGAQNTLDGISNTVGDFMEAVNAGTGAFEAGQFQQMLQEADDAYASANDLYSKFEEILDDPKAFLFGLGAMAIEDLSNTAKEYLAQVLSKALMKKNLMGDKADLYLRQYGVVDGLDGLDFKGSTLMPGGSGTICLTMTYEVEVIKLLGIEFKFKFRHMAVTNAWGSVEQKAPGNVVTGTSSSPALPQGRFITGEPKRKACRKGTACA